MWDKVGIVRDAAGLKAAQAELQALEAELEAYCVPNADRAFNMTWHDWLNLKSLVAVSRVIALAAAARCDSRGAHFRADFPSAGRWSLRVHQHYPWNGVDETSRLYARRPGQTLLHGVQNEVA